MPPPSGFASSPRSGGHDLSVCVVEKGSEVGAHILSGAVLEPRALEELFPDWREREAPLNTPVSEERFLFLTERGGFPWPNGLLPPSLRNHGNYIISLGNFCRWLAAQAEELGAEVFPGFAAAERALPGGRRGRRRSSPATWGWGATASPPTTSCPAWSFARSTPSSPKGAAATSGAN